MIGISKLYCGQVESSDALRYGRESGKLPSHLLQFSADKKPVVVWNMTQRCNLKCVHCYAHALEENGTDDISTAQGKALIDDLDLADWKKLMDVNLTGAVICAKHAARHMKKQQWGRIINISSVQAYLSSDTYSAYAASKAALSHLTHLWAKELAPWNITVKRVLPADGWR